MVRPCVARGLLRVGGTASPNDGAADWIAPHWPSPADMAGSRSTAACVTRPRPQQHRLLSRHKRRVRHRPVMCWTISKEIRAELRGRKWRPRWPIGAQAMSTPRSVSNCALPRLQAALHTRRHPLRTISDTGTPVHADIIALGDFKPGTAVNRDGPCKTVSVSLTEAIS